MTEIRVTNEGGYWIVSRDGATLDSHTDLTDARRHAKEVAGQEETASIGVDYPVVGFSTRLSL